MDNMQSSPSGDPAQVPAAADGSGSGATWFLRMRQPVNMGLLTSVLQSVSEHEGAEVRMRDSKENGVLFMDFYLPGDAPQS